MTTEGFLVAAALILAPFQASAAAFSSDEGAVRAPPLSFHFGAPACRMPRGKILPGKYYRYPWARTARPSGMETYPGESLFDGALADSMRMSYSFDKADVNNDGWCDWLVTLSIPSSSGGDRSTINTIYLGQPGGWRRVGQEIVGKDRPADFGHGPHQDFDFFETASFLHETTNNQLYVIGMFWDRHSSLSLKPGYHIYVWSKEKNSLVELDKWGAEDSVGAQAYAFFKTNKLSVGETDDKGDKFVTEVERAEFWHASRTLVQVCHRSAVPAEYINKCKVAQSAYPKVLADPDR